MASINTLTEIHDTAMLSEVARREYDWGEIDPNAAVAEVLAEIRNVEPDDIGPLYRWTNAEMIDALRSTRQDDELTDCTVSFTYDELLVAINSGGEVAIYSIENSP